MSENLRKFFKRKKKTGKACHQIAPRICLRSPKLHPRRIPKRCMAEKWISWIYETASIIFAARKPWGSHGRKRVYFDAWNSRCKTRNGDNPSMVFGRSQEQEGGYPGSVETLAGWVWFPDPFLGDLMSCLVTSSPPRLNLLSLVPESLQQHRWNDCYDWSIVFSWSLWSSHPWWAVVYITILCMLLVFVWAQSKLVHVNSSNPCPTQAAVTMRHVYGHSGNLGNECADHAAALGTFGLISNHNVATLWIHHNFDASVCDNCCDNISEVLERLQHIRTNATSFHQDRG